MKFTLILIATILLSAQAFSKVKNDGEIVMFDGFIMNTNAPLIKVKTNDDIVFVEVDEKNMDVDNLEFIKGERVTITGRVDHDYLEAYKVEASTIHLKERNQVIHASSADDEGASFTEDDPLYKMKSSGEMKLDIRGKVVKITPKMITVQTDLRKVNVNISNLPYNPLDDTGVTQIDLGDQVATSGSLKDGSHSLDTIDAYYLYEL